MVERARPLGQHGNDSAFRGMDVAALVARVFPVGKACSGYRRRVATCVSRFNASLCCQIAAQSKPLLGLHHSHEGRLIGGRLYRVQFLELEPGR